MPRTSLSAKLRSRPQAFHRRRRGPRRLELWPRIGGNSSADLKIVIVGAAQSPCRSPPIWRMWLLRMS